MAHLRLRARVERWLSRQWLLPRPAIGLRVLSRLYRSGLSVHRWWREQRIVSTLPHRKPLWLVGSAWVGGVGKTPLVFHMIDRCLAMGLRPGLITRGYPYHHPRPHVVTRSDQPSTVGDEPWMAFERFGLPVVVCSDRCRAMRAMEERDDVDVVLSDDGGQHWGLRPDRSWWVHDHQRGFGNGWLLPAGPCRVPPHWLDTHPCATYVWRHGLRVDAEQHAAPGYALVLSDIRWGGASGFGHVHDLQGETVHAVAGIGQPERFFEALASEGLEVIPHAVGDHAVLKPSDLHFSDGCPVLMTEKDGVKCHAWLPEHCGVVTTRCQPNQALTSSIQEAVDNLRSVVA